MHRVLEKMILLGTSNKPEMKDISWSLGKGKIFNMDNIILGKDTSFAKDFAVYELFLRQSLIYREEIC